MQQEAVQDAMMDEEDVGGPCLIGKLEVRNMNLKRLFVNYSATWHYSSRLQEASGAWILYS